MEKDKPVALNGIAFYTKKREHIVTESDAITFCDYDHMEKHIQARKKYWSELYDTELVLSADNNETIKEKQVLDILRLVCNRLGVDFKSARSKYRGEDEVEARRMTMAICHGRKLSKTIIGKSLGTDHANVKYHIGILNGLCEVDPKYQKTFLNIEDFVLSEIEGEFKEDGSGKNIKENEDKLIEILKEEMGDRFDESFAELIATRIDILYSKDSNRTTHSD